MLTQIEGYFRAGQPTRYLPRSWADPCHLKCAPTVTPLKVPLPNQIVVQRRKPRARLLELSDAPSRRQRRGARASHAAGSARFRAVLPGLAALFRRGAPCRYHDRGRPRRRACEDQDRSVGVTQGYVRPASLTWPIGGGVSDFGSSK